MKRLLVVSATPSLAMGLAAGGYETVVLRPSEVLHEPLPKVDVLVLDQERAEDALTLLERVRSRGLTCPVLLLLPGGPELSLAADAELPALQVMAKPVARDAFLSAVGRTAQLSRGRSRAPRAAVPMAEPVVVVPVFTPPKETSEPAAPAAQIDLREPPPPPAPRVQTAAELVRALTPLAGELFGVPETAQVIVEDAVERVGASAGALLVPDGARWRVAAGVGLRPLEYRYELAESSWLVSTIALAHKGAIIEDSDVARRPLQGAPLAGARNLLAAPVRAARALVILARQADPGFTEDDLTVLAAMADEAAMLLSAAMEARALARSLEHLRDAETRAPIAPGLTPRDA
jgi:hypothetical protein